MNKFSAAQWVMFSGIILQVNATDIGDTMRVELRAKKEVLHAPVTRYPSADYPNSNHSLSFTYRSNYYKNVPGNERTADDNIFFRPYIQTTSGAIYYYDELYRMGRRY